VIAGGVGLLLPAGGEVCWAQSQFDALLCDAGFTLPLLQETLKSATKINIKSFFKISLAHIV
jgi:hypothetical protein